MHLKTYPMKRRFIHLNLSPNRFPNRFQTCCPNFSEKNTSNDTPGFVKVISLSIKENLPYSWRQRSFIVLVFFLCIFLNPELSISIKKYIFIWYNSFPPASREFTLFYHSRANVGLPGKPRKGEADIIYTLRRSQNFLLHRICDPHGMTTFQHHWSALSVPAREEAYFLFPFWCHPFLHLAYLQAGLSVAQRHLNTRNTHFAHQHHLLGVAISLYESHKLALPVT